MMQDYIVDVSESDFEYEVLNYSHQTPVVVDFWAEWCGPCKVLGPILERLAEEGQGRFRLAKVNVDENPSLAQRFSVRGIPAVKAFRDGRVVAEFTGVQPEPRVREFIRALAPSPTDLTLEKGQSLLQVENWSGAEEAFRQVLDEQPGSAPGTLGLVKSLLAQGEGGEALRLLRSFPPSREYTRAEIMLPLAEALAQDTIETDFEEDDDPLAPAFRHALRLIRRGNLPAAMDGLLDILRQDKQYGDGKARKVLLGIFEVLGDENQLTRQYRSELASILF